LLIYKISSNRRSRFGDLSPPFNIHNYFAYLPASSILHVFMPLDINIAFCLCLLTTVPWRINWPCSSCEKHDKISWKYAALFSRYLQY